MKIYLVDVNTEDGLRLFGITLSKDEAISMLKDELAIDNEIGVITEIETGQKLYEDIGSLKHWHITLE